MMWGIVRRKVVSAGSSALVNGTVQSLERAGPALAGSISRGYAAANPISEALNLGRRLTLLRQFHQGAPVYLGSVRNVVASLKTDSTQMSSRSLSSGSATLKKSGDCEQISQIDTTKGPVENINTLAEKPSNGSISLDENAGGSFMMSAGVYGTLLSSPIVNPPQAAQLGLPSIASPTFLPNLALFGHIHNGVEEILADYVHHEMTRTLIMIIMRLFLIIAAKDVFLLTN